MAREDIVKVSGTSDGQRARWRAAAGDASLAAWMRRAADVALDGGAVLPVAEINRLEVALTTLRADLNRGVGNNLNQIAAVLNADVKAGLAPSAAPHEAALALAAASIERIRAEICDALAVVRGLRA